MHACIHTYQDKHTPLDLAVEEKKEEAAAVLRAHGALHSLHFAALTVTMLQKPHALGGFGLNKNFGSRIKKPQDQAGRLPPPRTLILDFTMTHPRYGKSHVHPIGQLTNIRRSDGAPETGWGSKGGG
jgi:hypothetical protein